MHSFAQKITWPSGRSLGQVLVSNWGRRFSVFKVRPPRLGELYLKPTGRKNVFYVYSCKQDDQKHPRPILVAWD